MPRIETATTANTPAASATLLEGVQKKLGMVPNLFKTIAHSPAALKFYFAQGEALATGKLSAGLRHQIALVTSGVNNCDYCASAHTLMGKGVGLQIEELAVNLLAQSSDAKVQAALTFSKLILEKQGHVSADDVQAVKGARIYKCTVLGWMVMSHQVNSVDRSSRRSRSLLSLPHSVIPFS